MYSHEHLPSEWFASRKRPRSYNHLPPMSRPVSKSFNRISDFIFPDTVHIRLQQQQQQLRQQQQHWQWQQQQQPPAFRRYQRAENYSLPVLNRQNRHYRDLIVVERVPVADLDNIDVLYREQQQNQHYDQQQRYPSNRSLRRRYSSNADEPQPGYDARMTTGLTGRSAAYRERLRDRRKRHTTDNAYHSMMKLMLEEDEEEGDESRGTNNGGPNYILSYTTTLDPISDSESGTSIHQARQQQTPDGHNITLEEWKRQTHGRVPMNGSIPLTVERERQRQRQHSSSLSSRDSSSDTDITARHVTTTNTTTATTVTNQAHYQPESSVRDRCVQQH